MYILKKSGIGSFKNSGDTSKDPELEILKKIDQGSITDHEINKVVKEGGAPLRFMEQRANRERTKLAQWDRKFGKGVFQGVTNSGMPFSDKQAGSVKNTEFSKEQSKYVKENLEPL